MPDQCPLCSYQEHEFRTTSIPWQNISERLIGQHVLQMLTAGMDLAGRVQEGMGQIQVRV